MMQEKSKKLDCFRLRFSLAVAMTACILFSFFSLANADEAPSAEQLFQDANKAYYEEQFDKAKEGYEELYDRGYQSAHILFNLGNVAYRKGDIGHAVLYYAKALKILPRNPDIRANWDFVIKKREDQFAVPMSQQIIKTLFFWNNYLTVSELCWTAGFISLLFWLLIIFRLYSRPEWSSWLLWPALAIYLLFSSSAVIKIWQEVKIHSAVVVAKVAPVRDAYLSNVKPSFDIHAGTVVSVIGSQKFSEEEQWYQISLQNGLSGWVEGEDIESL